MDDLRRTSSSEDDEIDFPKSAAPDWLNAIDDGISIRPYRPSDRRAVEAICEATGLRGELDALFCDRPLFVKLWLSPYLDGEPEHCVVAEQDGEVVGYLVGSVNPHFKQEAVRHLLPHVRTLLFRWLMGRYRHHPPSGHFVRWLVFRAWREMPRTPHAPNFHFNTTPELLATLVGERLIAQFEQYILEAGQRGWYAVLFSSPKKRPVRMYEKMGFEILDKKPCTLFPEGDVQAVTIYKPLGEWMRMIHIPLKGKTHPRETLAQTEKSLQQEQDPDDSEQEA
ncbi:MAG: hypothetical protein OHK0029_04450 [Armatimonadaceae bacterium]